DGDGRVRRRRSLLAGRARCRLAGCATRRPICRRDRADGRRCATGAGCSHPARCGHRGRSRRGRGVVVPSVRTASHDQAPGSHARGPAMTLTRRRFLHVLGGTGAAAALVSCGVDLTVTQAGELVRSEIPLPKPFRVPLPVPPVKRPVRTDGTTDYYEIVQRESAVEIVSGYQTPIFGYD